MSETKKIKPTAKMLTARKRIEQDRQVANDKSNEYYRKTNPEKAQLEKRKKKLQHDRDLAAEAAIGFGLAIKSIEENIRTIDSEIDTVQARIESERPYIQTVDKFKIEFGVSEYEVDWSAATGEMLDGGK